MNAIKRKHLNGRFRSVMIYSGSYLYTLPIPGLVLRLCLGGSTFEEVAADVRIDL